MGCVEKGQVAKIRAGTVNRLSGGTVHQAVEIIWESTWRTRFDDYAVIRVNPPFTFGAYVKPIRLGYGNPTGLTCYASGWGSNETTNYYSPTILQYIQVYALPENECSAYITRARYGVDYIKELHLCTWTSRGNVCFGDSGGPLTCYKNGIWQLYGIASFVFDRQCSWARNKPSAWADAASDYGRAWIRRKCRYCV